MAFMINRRTALAGAAALAAFPAAAEDKKVIIGTWGGDYSRLLTKNIDSLLKGVEVRACRGERRPAQGQDDGREGAAARHRRRAGPVGQRHVRRSTSRAWPSMLDYSKMSNAKNLIPAMKYPYGIGHIYSGKVVLYNPDMMKAPEGFADTLDPKHGNKLGIIDIQRQYVMVAAALASGGSVHDFEPGKERLIACRKAGARIYPSNEAFAQALKTGEIACGIMWKARAVQWQNAGIKVETWRPRKACRCTSRAS